MSAVTRIAALAGGCALVAGLTACGSTQKTDTPAAAPTASAVAPAVTSATPVPATSASAGGTSAPARDTAGGASAQIRGEREFAFLARVENKPRTLTVGPDGFATVTADPGDRSLFVTTPLAPGSQSYLMQTARMIEGGEPWCLQVHSAGGTEPLRLKTAACDAGKKDQIFTFPKSYDGKGRHIEVNGLFVAADTGDGRVIVQESGDGDRVSFFTVQDKGRSTLPRLGD
ncbi:hypothetical protein AB0G04_04435 [Actinoplanes sp. NPDC023801]|uniref:hypothetical protein n=1 Tax=Actinoplanes sp. NPDC023801 TaxID=3154595 RepID=UPI0033D14BBF